VEFLFDPSSCNCRAGSAIHRIYNPMKFHATATGYRFDGPYVRMDHHVPPSGSASDRGIFYGAPTYRGCLVEVLDDRYLDPTGRRHAVCSRPQLCDCSTCVAPARWPPVSTCGSASANHEESQPWARYFYDDPPMETSTGSRGSTATQMTKRTLFLDTRWKCVHHHFRRTAGLGNRRGY